MNYLQHKFIDNIDKLIKQKLFEISLAVKVKLVQKDKYDWFVAKIYQSISYELTAFINKKLDLLDTNLISDRLDNLIQTYLKTIKKGN